MQCRVFCYVICRACEQLCELVFTLFEDHELVASPNKDVRVGRFILASKSGRDLVVEQIQRVAHEVDTCELSSNVGCTDDTSVRLNEYWTNALARFCNGASNGRIPLSPFLFRRDVWNFATKREKCNRQLLERTNNSI